MKPLLIAATLAALATLPARAETVLRVGDQVGGVQSLLEASHGLDGAPYRIEFSQFPAAAPLLEALNADALDVGYTGDVPYLFAYAAGVPIKVIGALHYQAVDNALLAKVQENGGFDRVLLAFHATLPESILVAQHIAAVTTRLNLMIAHRSGFTAPTIAARQLATLDHISGGRVGVHIITGGNDAELAQDGDRLTKDERYARTDEYLDILRQEWTSRAPFDYKGRYYQVDRGFGGIKLVQPDGIPVYFGGASEAALQVAGRHADIYALWGETHAQVRELIGRVRAAAAPHGRSPRFSLSLRPILADTEEQAWAKADHLLALAKARVEAGAVRDSNNRRFDGSSLARDPANEGSKRLLAAAQGSRLDKRLWTCMAGLTGAQGNTTALVGTPDQVAEAMLDYYDLGIDTILIRGFDPIADAVAYGRDLLPRVRELVAKRDQQATRAVAAE